MNRVNSFSRRWIYRAAVPLTAALLVLAPAPSRALAAAGEKVLFQHRHVRLVQHTDSITGNRRCWIQAMFRAAPAERYMFAIGFSNDGRLTFHVRFPDQAAWLDSAGHALWLSDGSGHALRRLELTAGEALGTADPAAADAIVRSLIEQAQFSLTYARIDGVRRSRAEFTGLREVAEAAAASCEDARLLRLP